MTRESLHPARRAPLPPLPLNHELPRAHLVERLARRFEVPVTMVVAGAGFGKTTALGQAIRANDADPHGIDRWVSCEPGDEEGGHLAAAIAGDIGSGTPLDRVLAALGTWAPMDVCLFVDDVHELAEGSAGQRLLADLVPQLPPHAHLVLSSRTPPPVPLARLRAAQRVVDVGEDDLSFTTDEIAALTRMRGGDPAVGDQLAGWPSLVQLQLSARSGAATQFLWEEVVAGLAPELRQGLLALATLGWGTPEDVSEVAGGSVDADALADLVPLVRRDAEGRLHAHQLWEEATERIFVDVERGPLRRRALDLFARRGETMRLGWSAVQWRDGAALRVAARALARDTLGALPVQTAGRWIAQAPPDVLHAPEIRLLGLAVRQARGEVDPSMDGEIDVLATSFVGEGDQEGRAVALAIGAVIAYGRGDHLRLLHITSAFDDDVDAVRLPLLTFLSGAVAAAFASFSGDADAVLEILESLSYDDVPAEVTELVVRLHATMLALSGRADEAAALAGRLERSHDAHVRWLPSHFRWLAFDVDVEIDERAATPASGEINERDQFFHAAQIAAIAASRGDLAVVRRYLPMVVAMAARADARDATIGLMATVLCQVADHDEGAAERSLAAHLSRYPLKEPLCELHLRRHLAVSYLLAEGAAEHWDEQPLGPLHERTRSAARLLAELRRGAVADLGQLPQPEVVMTSLPLPWSVELAVRAHADGVVGAFDLAHRLGEWEPAAAARELARWSSDDSLPASLVESARVLGTAVAACSSPTVHVEVLGPLRVTAGGDALDAPDLRRSRVRTLLELLAVCGPIDRDRVIELIWPDAEPAAARQNLRVTLTRLRRALLAPGVPSTTPMVLADGDDLALASPPTLVVDLDRFRAIVAEADRRRDDGDTAATVVALHEAFDLWRGTALADLEEVAGLASEVDEARREVVDVGLRLGEALLVAGVFDAALRCAVRCRSASRYDERAHRLAIAANVHRQDHAGVQSAVGVLHEALAELGVEPQPSTMMLLRRAGEFSR